MPELRAELSGRLDLRPLVDGLLSEIQGPLGELTGISLPTSAEELAGVASGASGIDFSALQGALDQFATLAEPMLRSLPVANEVMRPLTAALDTVEQVTTGELVTQLQDFVARLGRELEGPREGGLLGLLHRVAQEASQAPESRALLDLLGVLTRGAGVDLTASFPLIEALGALDGAVRALGGLMALESVLSEAERLTATMEAQLDTTTLRHEIESLEAYLSGGAEPLADFVAAVRPDDPVGVAAAAAAAATCVARLGGLKERISAAMGLGEATLVYLDVDAVQREVGTATGLIRTADLDPLGRVARSLADGLQPFLALDIANAPVQNLEELLQRVERQVEEFAATIRALDPATLVGPIPEGIEALTRPLRELSDLLAQMTVGFRTAMGEVRDTVAALPMGRIADTIRSALDPITELLGALRELIEEIQDALESAANATRAALEQTEGVVDSFKSGIDALFADARAFVEQLDLDGVLATIGEGVKAFADVLEKARMQPYFDTAVEAIGTAADVVGAVPFELLPESMKSDVDVAVRPIKETDARAVEAEIEALLQISAEGQFELRGDLEQAIADIQHQYEALIEAVRSLDPRGALAQVDAKLQEVAARVHEISPALTLQPLQDAVDQVKTAIAAVDLERLLQPVRDAFAEILRAVDEYDPSRLVGDVEERIRAARERLEEELQLDQWAPTLDDLVARGQALLDQADPAVLGKQLEDALAEVVALADRFPRLRASGGLGGVLAPLFNGLGLRVHPTSFDQVLEWLDGASGTAALAARAARVSDSVAHTRDAVAGLDVAALSAGIVQHTGQLQDAVAALLAALPADAPDRPRLTVALDRLDAGRTFGELATNRTRYLARLTRSATLAETLRRTGFSEVDVTVANLRAALAPLQPTLEFAGQLLRHLGISGLELGLGGMLRSLLAIAPPARVVGVVQPIFDALKDRLDALLLAIVTPVQEGIAEIQRLLDAIDLAPFRGALSGVFAELKAQIQALHPDEVLGEPLGAFRALQDELTAQDPLAPVVAILTALRDAVERVLGKLKLEALAAAPLAIFDHILTELGQLDVTRLLDPIFEELDTIARQVDEGLDRTVEAFERLQAALPGGGGGSTVAVSASVGVG